MAKITYQDKTNEQAIVDRTKQVTAEDLNEIKNVVNEHDDEIINNIKKVFAIVSAFVKLINEDYNFLGFISENGDVINPTPDIPMNSTIDDFITQENVNANDVFLIVENVIIDDVHYSIGNLIKYTGTEFVKINTYGIEDLQNYIV